jgi:hypothetical protein
MSNAAGYSGPVDQYGNPIPSGSGNGAGGGGSSASTPSTGGVNFSAVNAPYNNQPQGQWTQTQALSAPEQKIFDAQTVLQAGQLGTAGGLLNKNMANILNNPNLVGMMGKYGLGGNSAPQYQGGTVSADQVAKATYDRNMSLLSPAMDQQRTALDQSLKAQGFDTTGQGGGDSGGAVTAKSLLDNSQNLVRQNAADSALANANTFATGELGRQETALQGQEGLFGLASNTAQQNYNLPINAISAVAGGGQTQTPGLPTTAGTGQLPGTDIMGAAQTGYGNSVGNWSAQNAQSQQFMNGLFGLANTGLAAYGMG